MCKVHNRIIIIGKYILTIICVGLLFLIMSTEVYAADDHDGDVKIIADMIDLQRTTAGNPLLFPGVDPNDPSTWNSSWNFVTWDTSYVDGRITGIDLNNSGLIAPIDFSGLTKLKTLDLSNNASLGEVTVEGSPGSNGALTDIDVSDCNLLGFLNVANNSLSSLDLSGHTNLKALYCQNNNLSSLDVSALTSLEQFFCSSNKLQDLNIDNCANLIVLHCESNLISSLDLNNCPDMKELWCFDNNLSTLNVRNLAELEELTCGENPLTELDVSGLANLTTLNCYKSQISVLNTSMCTSLNMFRIYLNPLTSFITPDGYICTTQAQGPGYGYINGYVLPATGNIPARTIYLRALEKDGSTFIHWIPITPSDTKINNPTLLSDEDTIPDLSSNPLANFVMPFENTTVRAIFEAKDIDDNNSTNNTNNKPANTGDSSKIYLFISLLGIAIIGLLIAFLKKNSLTKNR